MNIVDEPNVLSQAAVQRLEAPGYSFNPTVVILRNSPANLGKAVHDYGTLQPDGLLMMIDYPGHKVRTLAGANLTDKGVDNAFLQRMQTEAFVPKMRNKDLEGAISDSMKFVQTQATPRPVQTAQSVTYINQAPAVQTHVDANPLIGFVVIVGLVILTMYLMGKKSNLKQRVNDKIDAFKKEAVSLGNHAEALEPKPEANDWFVKLKQLTDDYDKFKVTRATDSDRLIAITGIYNQAVDLNREGYKLRYVPKLKTNVADSDQLWTKATPTETKFSSTVTDLVKNPPKVRYVDRTPSRPVIPTTNVNVVNVDNSSYTSAWVSQNSAPSPAKRNEEESESSSYSSSSSDSSWSSFSSDSGSSSWDSGSSSDSGSSNW